MRFMKISLIHLFFDAPENRIYRYSVGLVS
jgi:hypothetical protein